MLNLSLKAAKSAFFDRKAVTDAVDKGTRDVLSKFGSYVRQRARTSIRRRSGTSRPGSPPFSHVGLLRTGILFAFDAGRRSVVIGPTLLRPGSQVPALLEYGGTATIWHAKSKRRRKTRYRPRPYMQPAFDEELKGLPDLWKNSIR